MPRIQPLDTGPHSDGRVQYHRYDVQSCAAFAAAQRLIQRAAGAVQVEHIGSTAIPGLGGRNVVDIAVLVSDIQHLTVLASLRALGFQDAPHSHALPVLVGQLARPGSAFALLVYVVSPAASVLTNWLSFREYMRRHPEEVLRYDASKQLAIALRLDSDEDYESAKNAFLIGLSRKIRGVDMERHGNLTDRPETRS